MDGFVVLGRSGAVDAPNNPDQSGRRLVLSHAGGKSARPVGAGNRVGLWTGARRAFAWNLKHRRPRVEHRHQVVTPMRVGKTEHVWLLAYIDPPGRVESIRVWSCDIAERSIRVRSHPYQLPHRRFRTGRLGDVGHNAPRVLHRDQRITIDIRVCGDRGCFVRAQRSGSLLRRCTRSAKSDKYERERHGTRADAKSCLATLFHRGLLSEPFPGRVRGKRSW